MTGGRGPSSELTIVVPFKDAESLIIGLLSDLSFQTSSQFQVLFVDDASTDNTADIIRARAGSFKYEILDSSGVGPGAARNTGVRHASSDYIAFVDADDRIDAAYVDEFLARTSKGSDVIECMFKAVNESGKVLSTTWLEPFLQRKSRFEATLLGELARVSWAKAYRRQYILDHEIAFPEGIFNGEDHVFLLEAYLPDPQIEAIPKYLYAWVRRDTTLTGRAPDEKTVDDFVTVNLLKLQLARRFRGGDLLPQFYARVAKEARVQGREIAAKCSDAKALRARLARRLGESSELRDGLSAAAPGLFNELAGEPAPRAPHGMRVGAPLDVRGL